MTIHNKVFPYVVRVLRGDVRLGHLVNFSRNRLAAKSEVVSGKPTHLSFFVTSRCNSRCDMCPTHSDKMPESYPYRHREAPDLSLELLRRVLDLFPHVLRVPLIGVGEPLLNPQLFDLVQECSRRRMIVDTVSNGFVLDAFLADIVNSGLDLVCVSVNAASAADFRRMTGNPEPLYGTVLENVGKLVRARAVKRGGPRIELSFIVDRLNCAQMGEMIRVGEELGADAVLLNHFLPAPFPGFTPEERCLYADDPAVLEAFSRAMSGKYRCDVRWPYLLAPGSATRTLCRWPFSIVTVDGAGNVGGCPRALLNLHENGKVLGPSAWNNEFFRDLRRRHLHGDLLWPCTSCIEIFGVEPGQLIKRRQVPSKRSPDSGAGKTG